MPIHWMKGFHASAKTQNHFRQFNFYLSFFQQSPNYLQQQLVNKKNPLHASKYILNIKKKKSNICFPFYLTKAIYKANKEKIET